MRPRYYCPKCGMVEYCEKANGMPRYPETTLKVFKKRHEDCDGKPQYAAGVSFSKMEAK